MSIVGDASVGLEVIQRSALIRLFDNLPATITKINNEWIAKDNAFFAHLGLSAQPVTVEQIANTNFYTGHRPSLISAPIDKYPNVAVWAVAARPAPESALHDHAAIFNGSLFIEVMVKASSAEGEGVVNSRAQRTAEAVNLVISDDPTLGGVVSGLASDPTIEMADVFTRKERTAYGEHWFWQGARLEYTVRKETSLHPSPNAGFFRSVGPIDIDQM